MNKRTLISLLLGMLFCFGANAQKQLKNGRYRDRDGYREITGTIADHKFHGTFVTRTFHHDPEKLKPEWLITNITTYVNGEKSGITISFDYNGDTTAVGYYCNDRPCGHWRRKTDNRLVSICNYDSTGMPIGWQGYYNRYGYLIARDYFYGEGRYYSWKYNEVGQPLERGDHSAYGREGTWYFYTNLIPELRKDTFPVVVSQWQNGTETGLRKVYHFGVIQDEYEMLNGQYYGLHKQYLRGRLHLEETVYYSLVNGKRTAYAGNGNVLYIQNYRQNVLHGEELRYDTITNKVVHRTLYESGTAMLTEQWTSSGQLIYKEQLVGFDSLHYRYTKYYPGGARKEEGEYVRSQRHGRFQEWYSNGQRKTSTWYVHGKESQYLNIWNENGVLVYSATVRAGIACEDETVRSEIGVLLVRGTKAYDDQIQKYTPPGFASFQKHGYVLPTIIITGRNPNGRGMKRVTDHVDSSICKSSVQPQFPGGESARMRFFQQNMRYPVMDLEAGVQGTTYIEFTVKADGTIADVTVVKPVAASTGISMEAERVVKSMPNWIPAKVKGKPVDQKCVMAFRFEIV